MATSKKTAVVDLEKTISEMDLEQLVALKQDVDGRIKELKDVARDEFVANMRAKAEQLDLDLQELAGALGIYPTPSRIMQKSSNGPSAAIKYRNPKNPNETWSGRGRRAAWIIRELALKGLDEKSSIPEEFNEEGTK